MLFFFFQMKFQDSFKELSYHQKILSRPGRSQGLLSNTFVIHSFNNSFIKSSFIWNIFMAPSRPKFVLPVIKKNILPFFQKILNLEEHLNRCIGSKVTAILLNWCILPTCGVTSGGVSPAACAAGFIVNIWHIS